MTQGSEPMAAGTDALLTGGPPAEAGPPAEPDAAAQPDRHQSSSRFGSGLRAVTTRGRVAILVAGLAALVGVLTGWREWVGIASGVGVLLLAAVLMALGRSAAAVDVELPRTRFVVGEPGTATMVVRNPTGRRMLPLRMELEVGGEPLSVPVPTLRGGDTHAVTVALPTGRRAVVAIGPLRTVRGDVYGFIRRVVQWPVHRQVFVHPRTVRPNSALPGFVRDLEGEESMKRTASDLSFHTLREYVPGDDRRFIHWKSTARNGTLQVREFLQTHRSLVAVVLSGSSADYHWADDHRADDHWADDHRADDHGGDQHRGGQHWAEDHRADHLSGEDNGDPNRDPRDQRAPGDDEFEVAVSCAASIVAELVRQRRDVVTSAAGTVISALTAESVLDQFCAIDAAPQSPDLVFQTRAMSRRHPRASLVVLVFGSAVTAAQVRAAARSCPPGANLLAIRARAESSPFPARLTGSDAWRVLTVADIAALPNALRAAS